MICFSRLLEPDSASVVCCNVQLADYAGTLISMPYALSCALAPCKSPNSTDYVDPPLPLPDSLVHNGAAIFFLLSHGSAWLCWKRLLGVSDLPAAAWAPHIGPLIGLEIQAKHADHTLQPPINPLYQRPALSQPPISSLLPSSPLSCVSLIPHASRYRFCRLRDTSGCCERC